jgi:hypothetical protein
MTRHDGVMVHVCETCGAQFEQRPEVCPICDDSRQWVPEDGQRWTTREALAEERDQVVRQDGAFEGIGVEPAFAIGQRALLVPHGAGSLMWDCVPWVGDVEIGELTGIAISHPHYYTGMVDWAQRYDCPVHLHADDREWITRSDGRVELWEGETLDLGDGLTLIRCWVGFMYSYPNLIPLPEAAVRAIAEKLEPCEFDTIYGAWWDRIVRRDGAAIVQRSAERYVRALRGELP